MGIDGAWILTLNAGSSSLKFAAYELHSDRLIIAGQIAAIGPDARLIAGGNTAAVNAGDHAQAITAAMDWMTQNAGLSDAPAIASHRIVHGGDRNAPAEITSEVLADIQSAAALAPLHNPPALDVIGNLTAMYPDLRQVACFDTAFHADNPAEATTIPLPKNLRDKGIRRYGFHGLSYASLVRRFSQETTATLPRRVLALHLGAGASLAAIVNGKGVATTMGFSPMDGLVMATRAGAMDVGVILHLMRTEGMDADALEHLLNRESGLRGLSGGNADMKSLLESERPEDRFAIDHYIYWVCRHAGSMIATMQGVDGLVFTGGVGENATTIRERITANLSWAGEVPVWVIQADEEGELASVARAIGSAVLSESLSPK
mgnify:CR=1 FL=1